MPTLSSLYSATYKCSTDTLVSFSLGFATTLWLKGDVKPALAAGALSATASLISSLVAPLFRGFSERNKITYIASSMLKVNVALLSIAVIGSLTHYPVSPQSLIVMMAIQTLITERKLPYNSLFFVWG